MNARPLGFRRQFSAPMETTSSSPFDRVGPALGGVRRALLARQRADGSWREHAAGGLLEADVLILLAFRERGDEPRRPRLVRELLAQQLGDGAWADAPGEPGSPDATARAYLALRLSGHAAESPPLQRAGERLAGWRGRAVRESTRLLLALFGQLPHADDWTALPTHSPVQEWALRVIDAFRPTRPWPKEPPLAGLFADEMRLPAGRSWNPLRAWHGRRAGQQLRARLVESDPLESDGPTSILPLLALRCLEVPDDDPAARAAWRALDERSLTEGGRERVAPFASSLRDTALAVVALREAWLPMNSPPVARGGDWLWRRLVRGHARGDLGVADAALALLASARGGIAFRGDHPTLAEHVLHAVLDEQADDGGWGAPDLTGLVLEALGEFGLEVGDPAVDAAVGYLERTQEADCGWPGTLGVNYLHGTWRVLAGLRAVRHDCDSLTVKRACAWLKRAQHAGGGWGESAWGGPGEGEPTATHTAWALLGLMAAGAANSPEVDGGVNWLLATRDPAGSWPEEPAAGCDPHGRHHHPLHPLAFPLMALAQFERHAAGWPAAGDR